MHEQNFEEPLGQFQPNMAQIILGRRGFKEQEVLLIVQMKGCDLFQLDIITK